MTSIGERVTKMEQIYAECLGLAAARAGADINPGKNTFALVEMYEENVFKLLTQYAEILDKEKKGREKEVTHHYLVGDRVELSSSLSTVELNGDKYGTVVRITSKMVYVQLDKTNRTIKVFPLAIIGKVREL